MMRRQSRRRFMGGLAGATAALGARGTAEAQAPPRVSLADAGDRRRRLAGALRELNEAAGLGVTPDELERAEAYATGAILEAEAKLRPIGLDEGLELPALRPGDEHRLRGPHRCRGGGVPRAEAAPPGAAGALAKADVLVCPSDPTLTPKVGEAARLAGRERMWFEYGTVNLGNLTGAPAISIPCGFTPDGMPVGLQLYGRAFDEATVLSFAHAYERTTDWHGHRPKLAGLQADTEKGRSGDVRGVPSRP